MSKLLNCRVVVTHPKTQNAGLCDVLKARGADVIEMPLTEISPDSEEVIASEIFAMIGEYDWLVFSGELGVREFFKKFFARFKDLRWLGPCRIACVTPEARNAVEALHLEAEVVPEVATETALADKLLGEHDLENLKVCVVTDTPEPSPLAKRFTDDARAIVDTFPCNASHSDRLCAQTAIDDFRKHGADVIVFSETAAVHSFIAQAPNLRLEKTAKQPKVVAVGEAVAATLRQSGIPVAIIAENANPESVASAAASVVSA